MISDEENLYRYPDPCQGAAIIAEEALACKETLPSGHRRADAYMNS